MFRVYYSGRFSIQYSNLTITDQVFRSIVPGLLLQLIAFWLIGYSHERYVRLDVLGTLLLGAKEDRTIREGFSLVQEQLGAILLYYFVMLTLGVSLGYLAQHIVRHFKLDRRWSWLRYDNQWHYLLTGEILETPEQRSIGLPDAGVIDFIFVDVLLKLEKSNMLYSGILVDYELAADGGLRTIYLREAQRKSLGNGQSPKEIETEMANRPEEYYDVAGDLLVIPYAQTLNLNLTYYVGEKDALAMGTKPLVAHSQIEVTTVFVETDNSAVNPDIVL